MKLVRFTRDDEYGECGPHIWINPARVLGVYDYQKHDLPRVTIIRGDGLYFEVKESLTTVVSALEGAAQ